MELDWIYMSFNRLSNYLLLGLITSQRQLRFPKAFLNTHSGSLWCHRCDTAPVLIMFRQDNQRRRSLSARRLPIKNKATLCFENQSESFINEATFLISIDDSSDKLTRNGGPNYLCLHLARDKERIEQLHLSNGFASPTEVVK